MSKQHESLGGGDDWARMQVSRWGEAKSLGRVSGKAEGGGSGRVKSNRANGDVRGLHTSLVPAKKKSR